MFDNVVQLGHSIVEFPVVRQTVEQLGRSVVEGPFLDKLSNNWDVPYLKVHLFEKMSSCSNNWDVTKLTLGLNIINSFLHFFALKILHYTRIVDILSFKNLIFSQFVEPLNIQLRKVPVV